MFCKNAEIIDFSAYFIIYYGRYLNKMNDCAIRLSDFAEWLWQIEKFSRFIQRYFFCKLI